jgi:MFS family permease
MVIKESTENKPGAWLVVFLLSVIGLLNYLDRTIITTMRESIVHAIPMSDAEFGLLTSVFLWVYGLLSPFAGYLADRFNRSKVIIISLFVWSFITWLTAHVQTYNQLLATRALMGISEACYIPAALALIADYHGVKTRSLATGIHIGGVMLGSSLGFLGGWIAEKHEWTYAFSIFGVIGIVYAVLMLFILRDPKSGKQNNVLTKVVQKISMGNALKVLLNNKSFLLLIIFWGLLGAVSWMIMGWLPTYYKEHFNLSQTIAGLYATGYLYPLSMVGVMLGGLIADLWYKSNKYSRIYLPALGLLIAAPAVFLANSTSIVWLAVIGFMVYAFTRTFSDANLMPVLCMISDERYRATGYGILNMFSTIVGGVGIYASGALRDQQVDLGLLFKIASVSMIMCAILLYMIKRKIKTNNN